MQTPAPTEVEVLDVGAPRPPRLGARARRLLLGGLALVCVLGVLAWWADARARDAEAQSLAGCHEQALRADTRASTLLANMVAYVAPALSAVPAARRAGVVGPVARAAADGLPAVDAALARCAGLHVDRWHGDLSERRGAYVDYLTARVRRLEDVAADGAAYYREQPTLAQLRARAFGD
jgi:hypothetical protein